MDDGVKHRLSNVIAWAGFVAAMVTLLCGVLWGVLVLQPYEAEQASISAGRSEAAEIVIDEIINSLSSSGKVPDSLLEEAWRLREELEHEYTLQDAESKRRLRWANRFALTIGTSSTSAWLMLGGLNYIFFGAFRALPWKQVTDDD